MYLSCLQKRKEDIFIIYINLKSERRLGKMGDLFDDWELGVDWDD
jgi:hypothetical protein